MAHKKGQSGDRHAGGQNPEPPAPAGLPAARFRVEGDETAVLSFSLSSVALPDCLSVAERDVALGVIAGKTNAQIAAGRGTSARTVANQIASLFDKLGVRSRKEIMKLGCHTKEPMK